MAWIESHQSLGTHRKVFGLMEELHISDVTAIGTLHFLWWWALDNAPDGDITGIPDVTLAKACHWRTGGATGAQRLVCALLAVNWIDEVDGKRALHNWGDYGGKLASQRERNKERQRNFRERQGNAHVTVTSPLRNGATVQYTTVHNSISKDIHAQEVKKAQEKFSAFWNLYPLKKDKKGAEGIFLKLNPDDDLFKTIITTIERSLRTEDWQKEGGKYIPYPSTWLNRKRWEDEETPLPAPFNKNGGQHGTNQERTKKGYDEKQYPGGIGAPLFDASGRPL
jgi:hypothetical protein